MYSSNWPYVPERHRIEAQTACATSPKIGVNASKRPPPAPAKNEQGVIGELSRLLII